VVRVGQGAAGQSRREDGAFGRDHAESTARWFGDGALMACLRQALSTPEK
jgi:hypothetical protein